MKHTFFTLVFTVTVGVALAQNNQGEVTYTEKRKMNIMMDSANAEMMKNLPKEATAQTVLLFTPEASFYQSDKNNQTDNNIDQASDGNRVVIKMDQPDNKFYFDLKNNKLIQQRDFMSRKFLITSDIGKSDWKLTGNQKKILGYSCVEATRQEDDKKITAWFTNEIPVSSGPSLYGNLPGLILGVDVNDGALSITATKVDLKPIDASLMVKPTEGKKMTAEDFKKMQDEKTKEMQQQYGGNGNVIIKIQDDHH